MSNAEAEIKNLWERHLESEFAMKSPEEALATMTDDPRVTIVPTLISGRGREELRDFYSHHFLNQLPPDLEVTPVSRTIGEDRLVDELVIRFTHTNQMDWVLPGIAPTGEADRVRDGRGGPGQGWQDRGGEPVLGQRNDPAPGGPAA